MKKGLLLLLASCAAACAQSVAGSGALSGRVWEFDSIGLPDAEVVLNNPAIGVRRVMQTTSDGVFHMTGLPPGATYKLTVTRKNFRSWQSKEFAIDAGQTAVFDIELDAEGAADRTAAEGGRPVRNDTDGVGAAVAKLQVDSLPVRGRRWVELALLAPATTVNRATGQITFQNQLFSGAALTDGLFTGTGANERDSGAVNRTSLDAIHSFQVLSAGAPAEFGYTTGGALNVVTRSGSNALHGAAYGYFGNHTLSAADRYALGNGLFRHRGHGGISAGGPIAGDKIFYYSNFEVLDSRSQGLNRITSPLISETCQASVAQCMAATGFLQSQTNVLVPRFEHWVTGFGRIDYRRSASNSVGVSANVARSKAPEGSQYGAVAPNGGLLGNRTATYETHYSRAEWTSVPSARSVNELRAGFFYDRASTPASQPIPGAGNVSVSIGGVEVGATRAYPSRLIEERYHLLDNFRFSFGSHSVTIGGELVRNRYWRDELADLGGTYVYPTLSAFAQDFGAVNGRSYLTFTQTLANPVRELPVTEWRIYGQDTWQPLRRLRVTYGIRVERATLPQPNAISPTYYETGDIPSSVNAAPRLGAAYTLDDRTVVRFGAGLFHAPVNGDLLDALFLGNGEYQPSITVTPDQAGAPAFPSAISRINIPAGTKNLMWAAKLNNPYSRKLTVAVERQLKDQISVKASYLTSGGVKLWSARDMNLTGDVAPAIYMINDSSGRKTGEYSTDVWTTRSDANHGHLYQIENGGASSYHALAVQVRKLMGRELTAGASYTWSHAIDKVGGAPIGGVVPLNMSPTDQALDWGSSSTDQRHRLVLDWVWRPEAPGARSAMARYLLRGWEMSSVTTLASSQPATALVLVNGKQFPDITMAFPTSLNGSGGWSRVPFLPVNSLYSEPEYVVNARVTRVMRFTERVTGRLLFEAFNITNTQYDTHVNTVAYVATRGMLTPVLGLGAGNASHGYPNGTNARICQVAFRLQF